MPHFFSKKRNNREWPGNFRPGNKNWVPPYYWGVYLMRGWFTLENIQHPLKKIRFQGETLGIYWGDLQPLFSWIGCLPFNPSLSVTNQGPFVFKMGSAGSAWLFSISWKGIKKSSSVSDRVFLPKNSSTFKWLNFTILYLQILEYKNNEKVYNKNFWLADYCYVVLSAINFRPTLPFVQGIFAVFCYTKKPKNL